ncbi:30S ribosomal protein S3 [Candidatus Uhrbacteria bacterium]|nr:30S ribosomal protein S3 [Candidatus Uhrbacteria bacterium]
MGRKIHPRIFRTGVIYTWNSRWFADGRDYARLLREDIGIKEYLRKELKAFSVDRIEIERTARALTVTVHSAKPGAIIGRGGDGIENLKKKLAGIVSKGEKKVAINLNVMEVSRPNLSAEIVLQSMVSDIERRMPFRRVLKQHLDRVQKAGAKGVKLYVTGRLNGAEIAREEKVSWGSVPLHNLRADIDFASNFARTIFGTIGVKVWIYRGEVFGGSQARPEPLDQPKPAMRPRGRVPGKAIRRG